MTIDTRKKITTVISFSSIEDFFLSQCAHEAAIFSDHLMIVICDHLFDGKEENLSQIQKRLNKCPPAKTIVYPYLPDRLLQKKLYSRHGRHNISRIVAVHYLPKDTDFVLFLDADEIPEGKRFLSWIENEDLEKYDAYKFACYWYFRDIIWRAHTHETAALMMRKELLTHKLLWNKEERGGIFRDYPKRKKDWVMGTDQKPLFHHYSWVRSKENLLQKVRNWGHKGEKPWEDLVKEEFSRPFSGKDFVHGYTYEKIEPPFSFESTYICSQEIDFLSKEQLIQLLFGKIAYFKYQFFSSHAPS